MEVTYFQMWEKQVKWSRPAAPPSLTPAYKSLIQVVSQLKVQLQSLCVSPHCPKPPPPHPINAGCFAARAASSPNHQLNIRRFHHSCIGGFFKDSAAAPFEGSSMKNTHFESLTVLYFLSQLMDKEKNSTRFFFSLR